MKIYLFFDVIKTSAIEIFVITTLLALSVFPNSSVAQTQNCNIELPADAKNFLPNDGQFDVTLVNETVNSVMNQSRCENNLDGLTANRQMANAAVVHSDWMAQQSTLTHNSTLAGQETPSKRMAAQKLDLKRSAENVAQFPIYDFQGNSFLIKGTCKFSTQSGEDIQRYTYASIAKAIVEGWMNSPGHRANILAPDLKISGAAISLDADTEYCGNVYATQVYGTKF